MSEVKQISVLLPNVSGALARLNSILDNDGIWPRAVLQASTAENSQVRLVVNDPERAESILQTHNYNYEVTQVLVAEVPVHPGGINALLNPLAAAEINVLYLYTTINRKGRETIVILGVDRYDDAAAVLKANWISLVGDEIYSL
ncbi:MAG: hypothetical protein WC889_18990 [Myxococcota bacterium]|jgi:hypothetical protein